MHHYTRAEQADASRVHETCNTHAVRQKMKGMKLGKICGFFYSGFESYQRIETYR